MWTCWNVLVIAYSRYAWQSILYAVLVFICLCYESHGSHDYKSWFMAGSPLFLHSSITLRPY